MSTARPALSDAQVAEKIRDSSPELRQAWDDMKRIARAGSSPVSVETLIAGLIKEAKSALKQEEQELAVIIAARQEEAVLILNNVGIVTGVCKHSAEILGKEESEIIGLPIDAILQGRHKNVDASTDEMTRAEEGERVFANKTHQRSDGSTFEAEHTVVALVGRMGEVSGFARNIADVSDRRVHEIHIEEMNASVAVLISARSRKA